MASQITSMSTISSTACLDYHRRNICILWWESTGNQWIINFSNKGLVIQKLFAFHDDVIKWRHFPRYWPFVQRIHRSPVNSPHKGRWHGALMFPLICVWINVWVSNSEAGDLGRYQAHYDVTVMYGVIMRKHIKNEISLTQADDLAPLAANPSRAQARIPYNNCVFSGPGGHHYTSRCPSINARSSGDTILISTLAILSSTFFLGSDGITTSLKKLWVLKSIWLIDSACYRITALVNWIKNNQIKNIVWCEYVTDLRTSLVRYFAAINDFVCDISPSLSQEFHNSACVYS